ncbi:hypothetical protein GF402_05895 [Candidatus Fermentibacteria bacterium]|nr:hypothetical protein [Candidatus Fermentibacteria bacterium]
MQDKQGPHPPATTSQRHLGELEVNCREASKLIDLAVDGLATDEQLQLLEFHMMGCSRCRSSFQMTMDISRITRTLSSPTPPPDLEARVRQRLAAADSSPSLSRKAALFRRIAYGAPIAAALLLVFGLNTIHPGSQRSDEYASEAVVGPSKEIRKGVIAKQEVAVAPFSGYRRNASPLTF